MLLGRDALYIIHLELQCNQPMRSAPTLWRLFASCRWGPVPSPWPWRAGPERQTLQAQDAQVRSGPHLQLCLQII